MPPRDRPETQSPTKVVKMKNTPAKPGAPGAEPNLAVGSSPMKPAAAPARAPLPGIAPAPARPLPPARPTPSRPPAAASALAAARAAAATAAPAAPAADGLDTAVDVEPVTVPRSPVAGAKLAAEESPERPVSEPATNPIVQGTKRASVAPPPARPQAVPVVRRPVSPAVQIASSASAPRVSSALISPAALAARAAGGATESSRVRAAGTTAPGTPEATAIVKALPAPEGSAPAVVIAEGRRKRLDLGKWLIGGAVAVGALVVAILAGAFDRPSVPEPAAGAVPADEQSRRKRRAADDSELRSPGDPPRTVGNSPGSGQASAAKQEPPPETATPPEAARPPETATPPEVARRAPADEPPPETATPPATAAPPEVARRAPADEPPPETATPPETAKPAVTAKATKPATVATRPATVATRPATVATKPPPKRKPPATKPAARPTATSPKWDPDSLFLK